MFRLTTMLLRKILITIVVIFPLFAMAVDDVPQTAVLKGSENAIAINASLGEVKDLVLYDPTMIGFQDQLHKIKNFVYLMVDESGETGLVIPGDFTAKLTLEITYTTIQDQQHTVQQVLKVSYKKDGGTKYDRIQYFSFEGAKKFNVVIKNIEQEGTNVSWDFKKFLTLKSELVAVRDYKFDCGSAPSTPVHMPPTIEEPDELKVSWGLTINHFPTETDLEWAWIDETMESQYKNGSQWDFNLVFRNNASRVTLSASINFYDVPLMYDGKGYLFFRVRYAQVKESGQRIEGQWQNGNTPYYFEGHSKEVLNWQSTATYAEEGKRKVVVQYFDGSLRNRQTVTKDNVTGTTVVAETIYDFQGRPAIQVLPTPTLNTIIKYTKDFNTIVSGQAVGPIDFDQINNGELLCSKQTLPFNTASGAANYYSPQNPDHDNGINRFIPDAEGYVYAETRYMSDGRVAEQGGVGKEYQVGSDKSTKYYYGSPDQKQLVALFGTDAGTASHYFKNMVRDANGQYSVSYVDMHGRTVATALAGDAPGNLQALPSNTARGLTLNLLDQANNIVSGRTIESIKTLTLPKAGSYTFRYSLAGLSLTLQNCNLENVCYNCAYDLEIIITNECNLPDVPPIVKTYKNISIPAPNTECNLSADLDITFTEPLAEGSYTITKRLTISQENQDKYQETFLQNNTCKTLDEFVTEYQALFTLQAGNCKPTCEDCQVKIPATYDLFKAQFLDGTSITAVEVANIDAQLREAYDALKKQCEELCNGTSSGDPLADIRRDMLSDMVAGSGQYASETDANGLDLTKKPYNILNDKICWAERFRHPLNPNRSQGKYLNENGQIDPINDELATISFDQFIGRFKNSWAEQLLPYHPEYLKLLNAESKTYMSLSYKKDEEYRNSTTIQHGQTTYSLDLLTGDPFYGAPENAGYKNAMQQRIYVKDGSSVNYGDGVMRSFSLWQKAYMLEKCMAKGDIDFSCLNNIPSLPPTDVSTCTADWDAIWQRFVTLYLEAKQKDVNAFLETGLPRSANCLSLQPGVPFNEATPYNKVLWENRYNVHFTTSDEIRKYHPTVQPVPTSGGGMAYIDNQFAGNYADNCESYRDAWISQLMACPKIADLEQFTRDNLLTTITGRLKALCIEYSNVDHPFGSSTGPGGTLSFPDIIRQELLNAGISLDDVCHPYMIDFPPPYDLQPSFGTEEITNGQPEECFCDKLSSIETQKLSTGFNGTLLEYIKYKYGTELRPSHLDSLQRYCKGEYVQCVNLPKSIEIPPALQCGMNTKVCMSCGEITNFTNQFATEFGSQPFTDPTEEQAAYNRKYAQFMNFKTGFNKIWPEYLSFLKTCQEMPGQTCNSLQQIVKDFYLAYGSNLTGADCRQLFTNFFNNATGLVLNYNQIMAMFQEKCGELPDVCEPKVNCEAFGVAIADFYTLYGQAIAQASNCKDLFVQFFNNRYQPAVPYTWDDIANMYRSTCGRPLDVCSGNNCTRLQSILDAYYAAYGTVNTGSCTAFIDYFNNQMGTVHTMHEIRQMYSTCNIVLEVCELPYDCKTLNDLITTFINSNQNLNNAGCKFDFIDFMFQHLNVTHSYAEWMQIILNTCGTAPNICGESSDGNDCGSLTQVVSAYFATNPPQYADKNECWTHFVLFFNSYKGTSYDLDGLKELYLSSCGTLPDVCYRVKAVFTCERLELIQLLFTQNYPTPTATFGSNCQSSFANFFNSLSGVQMTFAEIQQVYLNQCGIHLSLCYDNENECLRLAGFHSGFTAMYLNIGLSPAAYIDLFTELYNREFKPRNYMYFRDIAAVYSTCNLTISVPPGFTANCTAYQAIARAYQTMYPFGQPDCRQAFADYFNKYFFTHLTYEAIIELYISECGMAPDICYSDVTTRSQSVVRTMTLPAPSATRPPMLCGLVEPFLPDVIVVEADPCEYIGKMALSYAEEQYEIYKENLKGEFEKSYYQKCIAAKERESFTVEINNFKEYHYTLYYYDQAGNLVQTIAPEGVRADYTQQFYDDVMLAKTTGGRETPQHIMPTQYRYNTLNQVVEQNSPDGGTSKFWYDRLGRLAISQNAKQRIFNHYSYTRYDEDLGRLEEVGQLTSTVAITQEISKVKADLINWLNDAWNTRVQITHTVYDVAAPGLCSPSPSVLCQKNLRNRVSHSYVQPSASYSKNNLPYASATYYTYDIHGNVDVLLQHYNDGIMQQVTGNAFKRMEFKYDLISGIVKEVAYQPGYGDQFYHRYSYNLENEITRVETSPDKFIWENDARYTYYKHGPLSRTGLGQLGVQGIDYAYTIQGWLKGVNSTAISTGSSETGCQPGSAYPILNVATRSQYGQPARYVASQEINFDEGFSSNEEDEFLAEIDPSAPPCVPVSTQYAAGDIGDDGAPGTTMARDAYGFALHYNNTDYKPIRTGGASPFAGVTTTSLPGFKQLFNGNIAAMSVNISKFNRPMLYNYGYDQLNRLVSMDAYNASNQLSGSPGFGSALDEYKERVTYDANGNILSYLRNGAASGTSMDNLLYQYPKSSDGKITSNRLRYVFDEVTGNPGNDIKTQTGLSHNQVNADLNNAQGNDNYQYDEIGNLIQDKTEKIDIAWNVYGKIESIAKEAKDGQPAKTILYTYDASGNRISKAVTPNGGATTTTWYVRDASGNVMAVYENNNSQLNNGHLSQTEVHMYGSSRLGLWQPGRDVETWTQVPVTALPDLADGGKTHTRKGAEKIYELSNHLGNVLVTINDRKIEIAQTGNTTLIDYYEAYVVTANDYYPFGMMMPGRKYSAGSEYRYGFNGQENDDEVKGEGNQLDFGARIYDTRLGKFLSCDRFTRSTPYYSPYLFAGNKPIVAIDQNGDIEIIIHTHRTYIDPFTGKKTTTTTSKTITITTVEDLGAAPKTVEVNVYLLHTAVLQQFGNMTRLGMETTSLSKIEDQKKTFGLRVEEGVGEVMKGAAKIIGVWQLTEAALGENLENGEKKSVAERWVDFADGVISGLTMRRMTVTARMRQWAIGAVADEIAEKSIPALMDLIGLKDENQKVVFGYYLAKAIVDSKTGKLNRIKDAILRCLEVGEKGAEYLIRELKALDIDLTMPKTREAAIRQAVSSELKEFSSESDTKIKADYIKKHGD